jgi:hypothetical protein
MTTAGLQNCSSMSVAKTDGPEQTTARQINEDIEDAQPSSGPGL